MDGDPALATRKSCLGGRVSVIGCFAPEIEFEIGVLNLDHRAMVVGRGWRRVELSRLPFKEVPLLGETLSPPLDASDASKPYSLDTKLAA